MANKQAFWMEEIIADTHLAALQQCPLDVISNMVKDLGAAGVATGLSTTATSPESTAVKVTAGRLWMGDGTHGELLADLQVDLTSYIPTTAGNSKYVTLLGSVAQQESVPVVTLDGSTVNSVITDVIQISVLQGIEASSNPALPAIPSNTTGIILSDILLTNGMGIIVLGNISQTRKGLFPNIGVVVADINTLTQQMATKSDQGHHHTIGDIDGLAAYIGGFTWTQDKIVGLGDALIALQTAITGLQNGKADINHNHDLIYHKKTGDEIHDGGFQVTKTPVAPQDVVRLLDLQGVSKSEVSIAPGSTIDSGYAYIGGLTIAWVRGPVTLFTGSTNPIVQLTTPVTFTNVLNYSLSTENAESDAASYNNDAWFQMLMGYGGNSFRVIAQCVGGNLSGWIRPVLVVMGTTVVANIQVSNSDLTLMEISGQTYPKLINLQFACINNIGTVTWAITGTTGGLTTGTPDANGLVQVSFPSTGTFTLTAQAVDSQGRTGSKTITLTLNPYAVSPITINNGNENVVADVYPFSIASALLSYSGGVDPITWSIQPGSGGTATNLTSAAISNVTGGKAITGTVSAAGTYYVNLRATDSNGTPQTTDKVITFNVTTYVDPTIGTYCFEADSTYVLMEDGKGMLLKDVRAGMYVLTTGEKQHERGGRGLYKALVTDTSLQPGSNNPYDHSIRVNGIKSTPNHAWASTPAQIGPGDWTHAKDITLDTLLISEQNGIPTPVHPSEVVTDTPVVLAGNLGTEAKTFYVGASENGPWFLVHNVYMLS